MPFTIQKSPLRLYANAKAVINNYLYLPGKDRVDHILQRLEAMTDQEIASGLEHCYKAFGNRHRNIKESFLLHVDFTAQKFNKKFEGYSIERKLLLGAYLTKEYSIQAAALFNPSIVPHPNQEGLQPGEQRILMSLRATGEGHISSICFQTGTVNDKGEISLDQRPQFYTCLKKNDSAKYTKEFVKERASVQSTFDAGVLDKLPEQFTEKQVKELFAVREFEGQRDSIAIVLELLDTNYELADASELPMNEKVIFPSAKGECMGMEDVRFVQCNMDTQSIYYGTYTAYDGRQIRTQLIETRDFNAFKIRTLFGEAISDKGMALFPEKINGRYMMVTRQGGENISIMSSANLYKWDSYQLLMAPKYDWELVQLGNCGSPIKTAKGWLLLTHGVGIMRTYVISAILLDLEDPTKIIGRLNKPFLEADETEREGYVPNVVYTCGLIKNGDYLIIPYAVSDSATGFVSIKLEEILEALTNATV
jgi:predicted GH43/DUF377 family glycosyl hydrolase